MNIQVAARDERSVTSTPRIPPRSRSRSARRKAIVTHEVSTQTAIATHDVSTQTELTCTAEELQRLLAWRALAIAAAQPLHPTSAEADNLGQVRTTRPPIFNIPQTPTQCFGFSSRPFPFNERAPDGPPIAASTIASPFQELTPLLLPVSGASDASPTRLGAGQRNVGAAQTQFIAAPPTPRHSRRPPGSNSSTSAGSSSDEASASPSCPTDDAVSPSVVPFSPLDRAGHLLYPLLAFLPQPKKS